MTKPWWSLVVLAWGCTGMRPSPFAMPEIPWRAREVGVGVTWSSAQCECFGSPQSFNLLRIDPELVPKMAIAAPAEAARVPTSQLARDRGALAAVNGGFFDTRTGAPDGLLVTGGVLRSVANPHRAFAWTLDASDACAIQPVHDLDLTRLRTALAAGPQLLRAGAVVLPPRKEDPRHPRTALGLLGDGSLLLLCADGRTPSAAGLTLVELTRFMDALHCVDALNLDGGGSTTMWLAAHGIVNFPCDNKLFDHEGERGVADAIVIDAPLVVVLDEDEAELAPAGAWNEAHATAALDGDCVTAHSPGASAVFHVALPRAGRFEVELMEPLGASHFAAAIDGAPCTVLPGDSNRRTRLGEFEVRDPRQAVEIVLKVAGTQLAVLDAMRIVEQRVDRSGR